MLKEFRAFVLRGNVVDLAIGVVIGAAFGRIVDQFTKGVISPLVSWAGSDTLDRRLVCVGETIVKAPDNISCSIIGPFRYGAVVNEIVSFVILAAVLFFFVVKPVNTLMAKFKAEEPTTQTTRECPECLSKVPTKARRCAYCTAEIGAAPA